MHIDLSFIRFLTLNICSSLNIGALFGAAKTIRDFEGVLWYGTSEGNKRKMFIMGNIFMIPSWLIRYYAPNARDVFGEEGANEYLFMCLHYIVLFYIQFGVLPFYVYKKWGWTKQDDKI